MKLTDLFVKNVRIPKRGQKSYFDRELVLRVSHGGKKTWRAYVRLDGKPRYAPLGFFDPDHPDALTLAEARVAARDAVAEMKSGLRSTTKLGRQDDRLASVFQRYMEREGSNLRSAYETQRIFDRYINPELGDKLIYDITRRHINQLLDAVEDGKLKGKDGRKLKGGTVMADQTLARLSRVFNWYALRHDRFVSPIIRRMKRTTGQDRRRKRKLSDDEIRLMWPLLDDAGTFGDIVKVLFLTAARKREVSGMCRSELRADNVWVIPEARYKTKLEHHVPLTPAALAVIERRPQIDNSDLLFTVHGRNPFTGFQKRKKKLDEAILNVMKQQAIAAGEDPAKVKPIPHWTVHDIRRTAKSLMQKAGISNFVSERVLGHMLPGIERTYDQHDYLDEKRHALEVLSAMIDRIVNPPSGNVTEFKRPAAG